jgi:hypothetical protein
MQRSKNEIVYALTRKGFQREAGDHRYYIYYRPNGEKSIIKTMISHGSLGDKIDDHLIGKMARQVKLNKSLFLQLVDCTLDQVKYDAQVFPTLTPTPASAPAPKKR